MAGVSVVIPAYNEAGSIRETVEGVRKAFEGSPHPLEIVVVDDGSADETAAIAEEAGARVIGHPTNKGYGNALLTGSRHAAHSWVAITDADGTYPVEELPAMLDEAEGRGLDMVVGARQGRHYEQNLLKRAARWVFKRLSEWVVGEPIPDINSGLRVMRRELIATFAAALSGGFSFTTSITIIAFQTGHHVVYRPIAYYPRTGQSHVRLVRDTLRALQIIVMAVVLFNPIKLFLLHAAGVAGFAIAMAALVLLLPGLYPPALVLSLGVLAGNIIVALGFLAVRQQIYLGGIDLPRRGYAPPPGPDAPPEHGNRD
ncbi:MAG: glycosyltransferase family 2 protein [Candidatus Hydrogenedentes bacterium]|nr:glycosyltransferase family 2 protein [Candidatus Hydrogenedentota bacterium]